MSEVYSREDCINDVLDNLARAYLDQAATIAAQAEKIAEMEKERDAAIVEATKWNACCAGLRAAIMRYIKENFSTATAKRAETELLERSQIFYKEAGQNLLDELATAQARIAALESVLQFYANEGTWLDDAAPDVAGTPVPYSAPVWSDLGNKAKAILKSKGAS